MPQLGALPSTVYLESTRCLIYCLHLFNLFLLHIITPPGSRSRSKYRYIDKGGIKESKVFARLKDGRYIELTKEQHLALVKSIMMGQNTEKTSQIVEFVKYKQLSGYDKFKQMGEQLKKPPK